MDGLRDIKTALSCPGVVDSIEQARSRDTDSAMVPAMVIAEQRVQQESKAAIEVTPSKKPAAMREKADGMNQTLENRRQPCV